MVFYLSKEEKEKIIDHYQDYEIDSKNVHAQKVFKYNNLTITLYKDKVMFQGPWSEISAEYRDYWHIFDAKEEFIIGNDEVGTGDYFGPIVVTSCYLGAGTLEKLRHLGIKDSKALDDKTIYQLANAIMKIVVFESVVINNRKYNQWIEQGYNANVIKAWGHNQVLVKILQHKNHYEKIVIDQFVDQKLYYQYLDNMEANKNRIIRENVFFTTKAESKFLAVACSAIISRYLFLEEIKKISEEIKMPVPLGAGKPVTDFFINNKEDLPKDLKRFLIRHTKYHFANTKLITKK